MFKLLRVLVLSTFLITSGIAQNERDDPTLIVQTGMSAYISALALSPDGKLIAAGTWDKTVTLWDVASKREIGSLTAHSFWVSGLSFSGDGRILVSCGDNKVRVWNVSTMSEELSFEVQDEDVVTVAISPDGQTIAGGGSEGHLWLWDVKTRQGQVIKTHGSSVKAVAFNVNGDLVATGGYDGRVELWSAKAGTLVKYLEDETRREICSIDFNRDASMLATGSEGKDYLGMSPKIDLWDLQTGKILKTFYGHTDTVNSVDFSYDGKRLASGSDDMQIKIWDVVTYTESKTLKGHFNGVTGVAFTRDGLTLVSGSGDQTIKLWDLASGSDMSLASHSSSISSVALSSNGNLLAIGAAGIIRLGEGVTNTIKLWDLSAGRLIATLPSSPATSIAFDPNSRFIAAGNSEGKVSVWDVQSRKLLHVLTVNSDSTGSDVTAVAFSPNGELLAGAGHSKLIKLWRAKDGKLLKVLRGHKTTIQAVVFSPDGTQLASASGGILGEKDDTVKLWDLRTGQVRHTLKGHKNPVMAVTFSPNGRVLASGSGDATIKLWDSKTGKEKLTIQNLSAVSGLQKSAAVMALTFANGEILVSGGDDGSTGYWNVNSGALVKNRKGHLTEVTSLAASRSLLISGGRDGLVKLWRLDTHELILSLTSLEDNAWAVVGPGGHLDSNKLENPEGIHWILSSHRTNPLPLEIFMRDYYEPRLLPRLLGNEKVRPAPNLSSLNRTQPAVKITEISEPDENGNVKVAVEASSTVSDTQRDQDGKPLRSGLFDLRLFRDGQLVGYTTSAEALAAGRAHANIVDSPALEFWRATHNVPLVNNKFTHSFEVRLPRRSNLKELEFTAYAFNLDRVKSVTDSVKFELKKPLREVKPKAYIISVGVNAYEHSDWDLSFAARDAEVSEKLLSETIGANGEHEVVAVKLVSDYTKISTGRAITHSLATKENFKTVLAILAGGKDKVDQKRVEEIPRADKLSKVNPEDLVLISFSSHGYTDTQGRFYLIPFDTGDRINYDSNRRIDPTSLEKFISSDELSEWLRDVDSSELILIIDTCYSAGAVEQPGFKPGPMGSLGMGQLAYDKGMRVLAASQTDDVALEIKKLRQGLLTYALMQEGLAKAKANKNGDRQITLEEWLNYGVDRVPSLYDDVKSGRFRSLKARDLQITAVVSGNPRNRSGFQQPQLFDFKRKRSQVVIGKLAGAAKS